MKRMAFVGIQRVSDEGAARFLRESSAALALIQRASITAQHEKCIVFESCAHQSAHHNARKYAAPG